MERLRLEGIEPVESASVMLGEAVANARRTIFDEASRATGSRPFATGTNLDRARRDLELFVLQHRLDPMVALGPRAAAMRSRVAPAFFDALYAENPDPWDFATSAYEQDKYAATIAALEGRRFTTGLEIGCSIGVLTQRLADHVDDLLAIDVAQAALEQARRRNPGVKFERREVPEQYPPGTFDLTVCSEVLYYLDKEAFDATLERLTGTVLQVHWRPVTQTYPFGGDDVRMLLTERFGAPDYSRETERYVLDRWDRCGC